MATTTHELARQLLAGPDVPVNAKPAKSTAKTPTACWCGCGGETKSRFVPGHDARFHGKAKKVARGELDGAVCLTELPHEEAETEFLRHIEMEIPRAQAKKALDAAAKAAKLVN